MTCPPKPHLGVTLSRARSQSLATSARLRYTCSWRVRGDDLGVVEAEADQHSLTARPRGGVWGWETLG